MAAEVSEAWAMTSAEQSVWAGNLPARLGMVIGSAERCGQAIAGNRLGRRNPTWLWFGNYPDLFEDALPSCP